MKRSIIQVVEAAYSLDGDDSAWLNGVCTAAAPMLDKGLGVAAFLYDATRDDWVQLLGMGGVNLRPELVRAVFDAPDQPGAAAERPQVVNIYRTASVTTFRSTLRLMPAISKAYSDSLIALGVPKADLLLVNAADPSQHGCLLTAFTAQQATWPLRTASSWRRAAAHIATGFRIRRRLRALETKLLTESPEAEAILTHDGRAEHAVGLAKHASSRETLRSAIVAVERARRMGHRNADEALGLWKALVDGRWSVLDCFDTDGRRYWVAHRNDPKVPDVRRLSLRERQVAAYAALGHSNKLMIAYELGLSLSTVAMHLRSAQAKLGAKSRVSLVQSFAEPRGSAHRA